MSFDYSNLDNYIFKDNIGEGNFGLVKLAIFKPTGEEFAVKILEKKIIKEKMKNTVFRELDIITKFNHINVVYVYEIIEKPETYYIIMEYCKNGELFDYIVKHKRLSEKEASIFFYQLVNGVIYIHSKGIAHRDLKPENLLLDKDNTLKIIDFGLSHEFNEESEFLKTKCGSPSYAAPEIILGKRYDGFKCDVWCCGIILYGMLCGFLPFEGETNKVLFKNIVECEPEMPDFLSKSTRDLLELILKDQPNERISIEEIMMHPFYLKGKRLCETEKYKQIKNQVSQRRYFRNTLEKNPSNINNNYNYNKKENENRHIMKISIDSGENDINNENKENIVNTTVNKKGESKNSLHFENKINLKLSVDTPKIEHKIPLILPTTPKIEQNNIEKPIKNLHTDNTEKHYKKIYNCNDDKKRESREKNENNEKLRTKKNSFRFKNEANNHAFSIDNARRTNRNLKEENINENIKKFIFSEYNNNENVLIDFLKGGVKLPLNSNNYQNMLQTIMNTTNNNRNKFAQYNSPNNQERVSILRHIKLKNYIPNHTEKYEKYKKYQFKNFNSLGNSPYNDRKINIRKSRVFNTIGNNKLSITANNDFSNNSNNNDTLNTSNIHYNNITINIKNLNVKDGDMLLKSYKNFANKYNSIDNDNSPDKNYIFKILDFNKKNKNNEINSIRKILNIDSNNDTMDGIRRERRNIYDNNPIISKKSQNRNNFHSTHQRISTNFKFGSPGTRYNMNLNTKLRKNEFLPLLRK